MRTLTRTLVVVLSVGGVAAEGPATMKAVRWHALGGPEVLRYEDAPKPAPGTGEVLIRVVAAGVNPVDWKLRERGPKGQVVDPPFITGFDVSGTVVSVGEGVTRFKPGDDAFAFLSIARGGGYAQFAIAKESEAALKPKTVDHVKAAAVPLASLTAWQALFDTAHLEPGQTVLVTGAAGGVGSFAVQLAKWKGATVIGTASAANQAFLRELGVDRPIDYTAGPFERGLANVDVVLDTVGGDTLDRSYGVLKPGGMVVSIAGATSDEKVKAHGVRATRIMVHPDASELAQIAALVDAGKVKPIVSEVLPLAEARRAQEQSATRHTRGKLVLRVSD